jgi:predicted phosphodiesterase
MRILVVGDVHEPCAHPGYIHFCRDLRDKYRCDKVVFIGDVVDFHAISFHASRPDLPGPKDEFEFAFKGVERWKRVFPKADVCIGNHDRRVVRLAESVNIPARFIRDYKETWETPGWTWGEEFVLDDVHYSHGEGCGGLHPAYNQMQKMLMSAVIGHVHTAGGVSWLANPQRRIFGVDTGCGIDERSLAFAYGKHFKRRAIISAAVVLDGIPYHEVMAMGPKERYHRSRFKGAARG